jgi:hypothetical protein
LIPATDRKAAVKAVQQRFPNHDANLSCALHRFDPFAADLILINAAPAGCFNLCA